MKSKIVVISISVVVILVIAAIFLVNQFNNTITFVSEDPLYPLASIDDLINWADVIALVDVTNIEASKIIDVVQDNNTYKEYVTDTTLNIKEIYKGDLQNSSNIIFRKNAISGEMEKLNLNETIIVFLQKDITSNTYYLAFGTQGVFRYNKETKEYKNINETKGSFTDIKAEIKRFNATPVEERDLIPTSSGASNI